MPFRYNEGELLEILSEYDLSEIDRGSWRVNGGFWSKVLGKLKGTDDQGDVHEDYVCADSSGEIFFKTSALPSDGTRCTNSIPDDHATTSMLSRPLDFTTKGLMSAEKDAKEGTPPLKQCSLPDSCMYVDLKTGPEGSQKPRTQPSFKGQPQQLNTENGSVTAVTICEDYDSSESLAYRLGDVSASPIKTPEEFDFIEFARKIRKEKNEEEAQKTKGHSQQLTGTTSAGEISGSDDDDNTFGCSELRPSSVLPSTTDTLPETNFKFTLTMKEWESIKPNDLHTYNSNKLTGAWTDLFAQKISEVRPGCAVVFYRNRVKKADSRKQTGCFFVGEGRCTDSSCVKFLLSIEEDPSRVGFAEVVVQQRGKIHHKQELRKTPLSGSRRRATGKITAKEGLSNTYFTLVNETQEEQLESGNVTHCQDKNVLKTLAAETRKAELYHSNVQVELLLTQSILRDEDDDSSKVKGYIQLISWSPLIVIMYTDAQCKIFRERAKAGTANLYFDATGTLVRRVPGQGDIYYYAVVLPHKDKGNSPLPLCEMLSSCQRTNVITLFLQTWRQSLVDIGCRNIYPAKMETDFSWALIHGSLMALNKEGIHHYLSKCWEICKGRLPSGSRANWTVIHVCCSHFIKLVQRRITHLIQDKRLQEFILHIVAVLQNTVVLSRATEVWQHLSALLNSRRMCQSTKQHLESLKCMIAKKGTKEDPIICNLSDVYPSVDINTVIEDGPIRSQSPYVAAFPEVFSLTDDINAPDSNYYAPMVEGILRCHFMPLIPLWSGLMLGNLKRHAESAPETENTEPEDRALTRDSNALVESWMRIVKHDTMQGKRRLHIGIFVRKMHVVLKGRVKAFRLSLGSRSRVPRQRGCLDDFDEAEEFWDRKTQCNERIKSKYFTSPSKIPAPKEKKKVQQDKFIWTCQSGQHLLVEQCHSGDENVDG